MALLIFMISDRYILYIQTVSPKSSDCKTKKVDIETIDVKRPMPHTYIYTRKTIFRRFAQIGSQAQLKNEIPRTLAQRPKNQGQCRS